VTTHNLNLIMQGGTSNPWSNTNNYNSFHGEYEAY